MKYVVVIDNSTNFLKLGDVVRNVDGNMFINSNGVRQELMNDQYIEYEQQLGDLFRVITTDDVFTKGQVVRLKRDDGDGVSMYESLRGFEWHHLYDYTTEEADVVPYCRELNIVPDRRELESKVDLHDLVERIFHESIATGYTRNDGKIVAVVPPELMEEMQSYLGEF